MLKRFGVEPTFSLLSFPGKWGLQCSGCVGSKEEAVLQTPAFTSLALRAQRQRPGLWSPQKIAFRPEWLGFIVGQEQPTHKVKTAGVLKKARVSLYQEGKQP